MDKAEVVIPLVIGDGTPTLYTNNGSRHFGDGEIKGQLGNGKWTVVYESGTSEEIKILKQKMYILEQEMLSQGKKLNILEDQTVNPYLRNAAASVLLYLYGAQPIIPTPISSRFQRMDAITAVRVKNCAYDLGYTSIKFSNIADNILGRRNNSVHPETTELLAVMVAKANAMIDAYPMTRKHLSEEVMIIEHFEEIRIFFPLV